jgi:hypothetical protein
MKFYNPFKPHIVQFENKYLVRRLNGFFWKYKATNTHGNEKPHWWYMWEHVSKYCTCGSLEQAMVLKDKVHG